MENDLRVEIEGELRKLFESIQAARRSGETQNEIEQHTGYFEMDWLARLLREQRAEMRGAKTEIEVLFEEGLLLKNQQQQQRDIKDAARLAQLAPEAQVVQWNNTRSGSDTNAFQQQERAREINEAKMGAETRINKNYAVLRHDLDKAIRQVEAGQQPSLSRDTEQRVEKAERSVQPLPWETGTEAPSPSPDTKKRSGPHR